MFSSADARLIGRCRCKRRTIFRHGFDIPQAEGDNPQVGTETSGVGTLRLSSPGAEMVRLDVGWSRQGGFQFHFAGGTKASGQRNRLR